jgi:hypothetical protein
MYEIIAVFLTLIALLICIWQARAKQNREPQEIPDGGENVFLARPCKKAELEIPEPTIEIELDEHTPNESPKLIQEPASIKETPLETPQQETAVQAQAQAQAQAQPQPQSQAQETTLQQAAQAQVEPELELKAQMSEPQTELQIELQIQTPAMHVSVSEPVHLQPELKVEEIAAIPVPAIPASISATEPSFIDDQKLRIIDILSTSSSPKTVKEIAQAYYGEGAYNKRKDSRIRRILAEMTREGLLIETNVENSKAYEVKKQQ